MNNGGLAKEGLLVSEMLKVKQNMMRISVSEADPTKKQVVYKTI